MASKRDFFFDADHSDNSNHDDRGYDSEADELSRWATLDRAAKRRRLFHSNAENQVEDGGQGDNLDFGLDTEVKEESLDDQKLVEQNTAATKLPKSDNSAAPKRSTLRPIPTAKVPHKDKEKTPGVIYLSSLPPYLRPSALRNLLTQRGFHPITRLFLTPASKASSHHSKKNSRQLYTEGWIEFASKKVARRCAETLNAASVGGKKGGFYHDDVWNMKYLRGMAWDELMAGVREERREEEGRRDEERRIIAGEAKRFVEGVERGKMEEGMRRKGKKRKAEDPDGLDSADDRAENVKRTWRQFEVKGSDQIKGRIEGKRKEHADDGDVQAVLGKIF